MMLYKAHTFEVGLCSAVFFCLGPCPASIFYSRGPASVIQLLPYQDSTFCLTWSSRRCTCIFQCW
jgi:hypothetical protein